MRQKKAERYGTAKKRVMPVRRQGAAARYLPKLKQFYFQHKRMPSYGELAEVLKYKSKYGALYLVNQWIEAGLVQRDFAGKLLPGRAFNPLKVLGSIKAGWPSPAEEENADTISLDDWLIENKEGSFMLKVSGNSMIEAGIMPGDMVIIDRGKRAKNGDIVVAEVDREWTIKFFVQAGGGGRRKGHRVMLKPANKNYKNIVPKEELKIAGVVRAVIRKY